MKVRFYRGPMDGKVREARDDMSVIQVQYTPKAKEKYRYWNPADNYAPVEVWAQSTLYRRTRFVHPDGSVFFEWDKPKGTKI